MNDYDKWDHHQICMATAHSSLWTNCDRDLDVYGCKLGFVEWTWIARHIEEFHRWKIHDVTGHLGGYFRGWTD